MRPIQRACSWECYHAIDKHVGNREGLRFIVSQCIKLDEVRKSKRIAISALRLALQTCHFSHEKAATKRAILRMRCELAAHTLSELALWVKEVEMRGPVGAYLHQMTVPHLLRFDLV